MFRRFLFVMAILALSSSAFGQLSDDGLPVKVFTDSDMGPVNFWYNDTVYNIQGFVYVDSGEVLVIEPGTIIKGNEGQGSGATALVVARHGRIFAEGTQTRPIIFTSIVDDLDILGDVPLTGDDARGRWGGLIILSEGQTNQSGGVDQIEGIPEIEPRGEYGGTNDDASSGIVKYVSVRHGGSEIGAANEINGVTLGSVGRGTVMNHIDVSYNLDDGFEFFGGAVDLCYASVTAVGDDGFDYDEGWRGFGQFWFLLMVADSAVGDNGGEWDGADDPFAGEPFATPLITNMTSIGKGVGALTPNRGLRIRVNAGCGVYNSIITEHSDDGVRVDEDGTLSGRLRGGQIKIYNNIWWDFADWSGAATLADTQLATCNGQQEVADSLFTNWANVISDPGLTSVSRITDGGLDPRPTSVGGFAWVNPLDANPAIGYFPETNDPTGTAIQVDKADWAARLKVVAYPGAFDPNPNVPLWICNWTALDLYGFIDEDCSGDLAANIDCNDDENGGKDVVVFNDSTIGGEVQQQSYTLNRENVYNLAGFTFVDSGEVLVIEPGVVIKGNEGQGSAASALVVARGGQIYAYGREDCPIIFTSIVDFDINLFTDIPLTGDDARGRWGGVIILGAGKTNQSGGTDQIEGIPEIEPRGEYGGTNDDDNSGVMQYFSIRHGGSEIGAANEINGLTMGSVGRGTIIRYGEVFFNLDDGMECFGGAVNTDHMSMFGVGDDGFDYDEGWRGSNQFWFQLHVADSAVSDNGGEWDGADDPFLGEPFATPLITNATFVGKGIDALTPNRGLRIRVNAGVGLYNSIVTDHKDDGVRIDDDGTLDRLRTGHIKIVNNLFYRFGDGNTPLAICNGDQEVADSLFDDQRSNWWQNYAQDPVMVSISRINNGMLDPRPAAIDCSDWSGWVDPFNDANLAYDPQDISGDEVQVDFVNWEDHIDQTVDYPGAFDPDMAITSSWVAGWTALTAYGYLGDKSCCLGRRADVDVSRNDPFEVDSSDLGSLVNFLFAPPGTVCLRCVEEADVDGLGGANPVDSSDLGTLVAFLFANPPGSVTLVDCP